MKSVINMLKQTPFSYLGMTFAIAWVYVVFYTPALSPLNSLDINAINIYRACNLVSSLTAFLLLTSLQKRFGEISLNLHVQVASSLLVCGCTLVVALIPTNSPEGLIVGITTCAIASICSTSMYVAWGHFYGLPFNRSSKIILPVASAISMILCLICLFLTGIGLTIIAALLPLLSLAFYRKAIFESRSILGKHAQPEQSLEVPEAADTSETEVAVMLELDESKAVVSESSGRFPWRIAFVLAIFWFIFTFMNIQTAGSHPANHEVLYGWGFICGFLGSIFVIYQFTDPRRHTTFSTVFKAAIPLLLLGVIMLLLLPEQSVIVVHSICLMAMTILNIHILIFGAVFVRKNILSSTTSFAGLRIFASAGEGLALITFLLVVPQFDYMVLAVSLAVMIAILVCALLLAMTDTNIDNFHDNRDIRYHSAVSRAAVRPGHIGDLGESRVRAMAAFELACHEIAKIYELSARETEVLILFGRGRDLPYICEHLYISKPTTNTHIRHIYEKIGIHSKQELLDLLEQRDLEASDCQGDCQTSDCVKNTPHATNNRRFCHVVQTSPILVQGDIARLPKTSVSAYGRCKGMEANDGIV
jgi:DNA-binding CsgD family transcriptional regulator